MAENIFPLWDEGLCDLDEWMSLMQTDYTTLCSRQEKWHQRSTRGSTKYSSTNTLARYSWMAPFLIDGWIWAGKTVGICTKIYCSPAVQEKDGS
jgi:hypothetical protein